MISLDERLASVEGILSIQERERMRDESQGLPLSPSQVENILARLTLVESRVKSIKSKVSFFIELCNGLVKEMAYKCIYRLLPGSYFGPSTFLSAFYSA